MIKEKNKLIKTYVPGNIQCNQESETSKAYVTIKETKSNNNNNYKLINK